MSKLLAPRFKVIADYPFADFNVGDIIDLSVVTDFEGEYGFNLGSYPHLFDKVDWWEHRTIEELKAVKYVKVTRYVGYWLVGDIVPTKRFVMEENKPYGYMLPTDKFHGVFDVLPATKEEYDTYINSINTNGK